MTREDIIYDWKVNGGSMSWSRWAAYHEIPVKSTKWLEDLQNRLQSTPSLAPAPSQRVLKPREQR